MAKRLTFKDRLTRTVEKAAGLEPAATHGTTIFVGIGISLDEWERLVDAEQRRVVETPERPAVIVMTRRKERKGNGVPGSQDQ